MLIHYNNTKLDPIVILQRLLSGSSQQKRPLHSTIQVPVFSVTIYLCKMKPENRSNTQQEQLIQHCEIILFCGP